MLGLIAKANDLMHQAHACTGKVATEHGTYPQCAEVLNTLRKRWAFCTFELAKARKLASTLHQLLVGLLSTGGADAASAILGMDTRFLNL